MNTKDIALPLEGFLHHSQLLNIGEQRRLLADIQQCEIEAPYFQPTMPGTGQPLSVKMTSCGALGWVSDKSGYRYERNHPLTGKPWPSIPESALEVWRNCYDGRVEPDTCLINFYAPTARLGLHRDEDEDTYEYPIVSVSLGMAATFQIGGLRREDPKRSLRLFSGDIVVLGGNSRLAYHGVSRILKSQPDPLHLRGRVNLTLRRVRK